jgi:hypothetical protein
MKRIGLKTFGFIVAFVLGQATQLVIHGVCLANNMYNYRQIPFCLAGGFVILAAVIGGVVIAREQDDRLEREYKHGKNYMEYVEEARVREAETIDR